MIPPIQAIFISGPGYSNIAQRYPTDKLLPKYQVNQLHCLLDRNLSSGQCDPSSEQQGHSGIFNSCTRTNGRKNEMSIPEIFRKMFVGLSNFFSVFISFTNLRRFFWVGAFCKRHSANVRGFPTVTPAEMAADKCIKLQQRSDILRLLRFQPSRLNVLPPPSMIFSRFSRKNCLS